MHAIADPVELQYARLWHGFTEVFDADIDATNQWAKTAPNSGTAVVSDGVGNGLTLTPSTLTTDNDEIYVDRKYETFKPAASRPFFGETRLAYTQGATNAGNICFGFADAVGANLLVDDGAGPKTSGSFILFFSKDGGLNWWVGVSISTTQTLKELTAAQSLDKQAHTAGSSSDQTLRIEVMPKANSKADVAFLINGVVVYKIMDWDFTSVTDMQAVIGAKNGTTANELPKFYYMSAHQRRA